MHEKLAELKAQGLTSWITTQFGFDANPVIDWLRQLRGDRMETPVRVGIPGPASARTLLNFAARCGVEASTSVLAKYGLSLSKLLTTTGPNEILGEFGSKLEQGVHGTVRLHFYPFGGLLKTIEWIDLCRMEKALSSRNGEVTNFQDQARE